MLQTGPTGLDRIRAVQFVSSSEVRVPLPNVYINGAYIKVISVSQFAAFDNVQCS